MIINKLINVLNVKMDIIYYKIIHVVKYHLNLFHIVLNIKMYKIVYNVNQNIIQKVILNVHKLHPQKIVYFMIQVLIKLNVNNVKQVYIMMDKYVKKE